MYFIAHKKSTNIQGLISMVENDICDLQYKYIMQVIQEKDLTFLVDLFEKRINLIKNIYNEHESNILDCYLYIKDYYKKKNPCALILELEKNIRTFINNLDDVTKSNVMNAMEQRIQENRYNNNELINQTLNILYNYYKNDDTQSFCMLIAQRLIINPHTLPNKMLNLIEKINLIYGDDENEIIKKISEAMDSKNYLSFLQNWKFFINSTQPLNCSKNFMQKIIKFIVQEEDFIDLYDAIFYWFEILKQCHIDISEFNNNSYNLQYHVQIIYNHCLAESLL